jgi:hypothetical protein
MSLRNCTSLLTVVCLMLLLPLTALADDPPSSSEPETKFGVGFGGYSMVDNEPLTTTTVSFNLPKVLLGASFSVRTGESQTNMIIGGKVLVKVKQMGGTMFGLGGSIAFITNAASGEDTRTGLGFGGGVEHMLSKRLAVSADLYPLSLEFASGGTRVGIFSSGALGATFYF